MKIDFPPTRAAALERLNAFVPNAGRDYASLRNYDLPGHENVSHLSPYLRYGIISQKEVLETVLRHHSPSAAEKFIQEILWRTYWKGVLERRPALWARYKTSVKTGWNRIQSEAGLRADWEAACTGNTGIDCFDHWAKELVETGYLHNHARMWFASIWVYTLRLPWALGADFFLRHLLDGCPASNTLSWRWVCGLQTQGKTYLARPDNIAKYTQGRFQPKGLAQVAPPLDDGPLPPLMPCPVNDYAESNTHRIGVLLTADDLNPDHILQPNVVSSLMLRTEGLCGPLKSSQSVNKFVHHASDDCTARLDSLYGPIGSAETVQGILDWALENQLSHVRTSYICQGPIKDHLADLTTALKNKNIILINMLREIDAKAWPKATHGFFKFKAIIPELITDPRQMILI